MKTRHFVFSHTSTCLAQFREQRFRLSNGQASSVAKVATPNSKRLPNFLMILRRHISLNQCSGRCARSFFSRALRPPPDIAIDLLRYRCGRRARSFCSRALRPPRSQAKYPAVCTAALRSSPNNRCGRRAGSFYISRAIFRIIISKYCEISIFNSIKDNG